MTRLSRLKGFRKTLALSLCLPFMLTVPQIADAGDATSPVTEVVTAEVNQRALVLRPEHGEVYRGAFLTVFFAFDSAELTTPSRRALDTIAPALRAHLRDGGLVLIEGHADEVGAAHYNIALSERRAGAIAAYLRDAWEIPVPRLTLRGWGASDLRRPDAPHHAENRRVEISLLAPRHARTRGITVRPLGSDHLVGRHLDIDDFGGAMSPLPMTRHIITAPAPIRQRH